MKKIALVMSLAALAGPIAATAQTPPRRLQAPASRFSIDTAIRDILANPAARAAVQRHMPSLASSEHLPRFQHMSIRELAATPHAQIPTGRIQALQADLVRIR